MILLYRKNILRSFVLLSLYLLASCSFFQTVDHSVELNGVMQQGSLIVGSAPEGSQVFFNQQELKVTPSGDFAFGFGRDFKGAAELKVVMPDGFIWQQQLEVAVREYDIQRVEGISKKIMSKKKTPRTLARIRKETAAVKSARAQHFDLQDFTQKFKWPLNGPITGVFGSQRVYNGQPGRPHYGVDIAAPVGTRVYAPADGVVTLAYDDMFYSGGTLIIDHGYSVSSSFLHLSKVLVKVGDKVKQGDEVAEVGAGGRASGPHLDWRMNWQNQRVDPQLLVPKMKQELKQ